MLSTPSSSSSSSSSPPSSTPSPSFLLRRQTKIREAGDPEQLLSLREGHPLNHRRLPLIVAAITTYLDLSNRTAKTAARKLIDHLSIAHLASPLHTLVQHHVPALNFHRCQLSTQIRYWDHSHCKSHTFASEPRSSLVLAFNEARKVRGGHDYTQFLCI